MYRVQDSSALVAGSRTLLRARTGASVSRTVVLLGVTSMLTDISAEMVSTVLPLYLVYVAGFTPLQFGIVDGLYRGAAAIVGLVSGFAADRRRRHKEVASIGYGLSTVCKLALVVVGGTASAIGAIVMLDRIGKGIRTAPRDALISLSSTRERLGAAFGVHRAMDTTGAMIGPLIAFGLLALAPLAFHSVFLVSFCFGLAGLGVIVLLVPSRPAAVVEERSPAGLREMGRLLAEPRFRGVVVAAVLLGLTTISDAFLYLALQRHLDLPATAFPLLFVGASTAFMLLAVPAGRLADRVGRGRVFVLGYVALLPVYVSLVLPAGGAIALAGCLTLVGASYAATDGVLAALGAATLAEEVRASGLAVIGTATNASRLLASIAFGAVWTLAGLQTAVLVAAAGLAVALAVTAVVLARTREVLAGG
jgi:MFS family permease